MGNNLPTGNVPENGSAAGRFDARARRLLTCGSPAEPPRSWRAAALDAPRLFALMVADDADESTPGEAEVEEEPAEVPVEGDGQPGEVVVWGLSFDERAVVFLHNPLTGRKDFGTFTSAEHARRFYSLFGELHLVYV